MNKTQHEYFVTRYSLIPDAQIDIETASGVTKEEKFMNWLNSFSEINKKETTYRNTNYVLYCKKRSDNCFILSFGKALKDSVGEKTETGIIDTTISNYKKCTILFNIPRQWILIQKNSAIASDIEQQKNLISRVITQFLNDYHLVFSIDLITQKRHFWEYIKANKDSITEIEITLSSPNFLRGIKTVTDILHQTNDIYNNTSIGVQLQNTEGHLTINEDNEFLKDAIKYSSAGGGKWKVKSSTDQIYKSTDNPYIINLPSDLYEEFENEENQGFIKDAFSEVKNYDVEVD